MQIEILEQLQTAQTDLIAALDASDAEGIRASSAAVHRASEQLRELGNVATDPQSREQLEILKKMNRAAAQRLRFMQDHVSTRLSTLHGSDAGATYAARYGKPRMRAMSAS
jgi:hypothetical protein